MKSGFRDKKLVSRLLLIVVGFVVATAIIFGLSSRKIRHEYCWAKETTSGEMNETHIQPSEIMNSLRNVRDPEIDINIVDLGLVYEVRTEGTAVFITMTLTTPACPYGLELIRDVKKEVMKENVRSLRLIVTFDPPWTVEKMAPDIGLKRFSQERSMQ
ncbi:metal-sulfur cluster assembly factor [Desulfomonile tiedjei]|uniref:Putative metal-sulfur cluster biosynthetic enzyme n=1 Tax=Desulfomonile tiedjei (strain ATCC 49306 / DSM 6799 / DCB-1) TaxID=706587 RepID=U3GL02_DESTA|nr:metal-sulfur cluster assembly factor [Desulfomonile tiedjei]AFM23504.1 putative metal-sulfur cluster biosynthetic enzyme [Desulfomonile tiedjei DSM 6799]